jgi:hypothetical protein
MSEEEPEVSESGQPIFRHKPKKRDFDIATGSEESAVEAIVDHVETHLGKIDIVFHELISDLVHIDVHQIKPTRERNFWTLITTGMSDRPMTVPEGVTDAHYAELMICLPPSWKISDEAFKDEANYWPIGLLKLLSRLPHEYGTWLAPGHTIPNADPPEPYAPDTKFCCAMLVNPLTTPPEFDQFEAGTGKVIRFLAVIPLYLEEVELKLKQGSDELIKRLEKQGVTEVLKPGRKNVARRSIWPF